MKNAIALLFALIVVYLAWAQTGMPDVQASYARASQLIAAGRLDEAVTAARETDQVARRAATASGADVNTIATLVG